MILAWCMCSSDFAAAQYESRTQAGLELMRSIVATVMWRHRKPHVEHEIELPACTVRDEFLALSPLEKSYYDRRHEELVRSLKSQRPTSVSLTPDTLAKLTTLRQVCRRWRCRDATGGGMFALCMLRLTWL